MFAWKSNLDEALLGDETAQILTEAFLPEILPKITDLSQLVVKHSSPWSVSPKPGFSWAINLALSCDPCSFTRRLIMSLEPQSSNSVLSEELHQEMRGRQKDILNKHLVRHWQIGVLTTAQLVQFTRASLDCEDLLDCVIEMAAKMQQNFPEHAPLQTWLKLVVELANIRQERAQDCQGNEDDEWSSNATDDDL